MSGNGSGDVFPFTTGAFSEQALREASTRVLERKEDLWVMLRYMQAVYIEAWMATDTDDVSAREAAFHKYQLVEELRTIVNNFAAMKDFSDKRILVAMRKNLDK